MNNVASPLRYPGGKACLINTTVEILRLNRLERKPYGEPYAGGCGLALSLLFGGYVSEIHINDIDPAIWCFWSSVLNDSESLIEKIKITPVSMDQWYKQREMIQNPMSATELELGFATFFLNRTNRSGIIKNAGVIGGYAQDGAYKLDCRFNKDSLVKKIRRIAKYANRIHLSNLDALDFVRNCDKNLPNSSFLFVDPPYFKKGSSLYTSFYDESDHKELSDAILAYNKPWIITYDNADYIRKIYKVRRQYEFYLNYSVQSKRKGTEILVASKGLKIPPALKDRQVNKPQYRVA